jgi:hypothetical protein
MSFLKATPSISLFGLLRPGVDGGERASPARCFGVVRSRESTLSLFVSFLSFPLWYVYRKNKKTTKKWVIESPLSGGEERLWLLVVCDGSSR